MSVDVLKSVITIKGVGLREYAFASMQECKTKITTLVWQPFADIVMLLLQRMFICLWK